MNNAEIDTKVSEALGDFIISPYSRDSNLAISLFDAMGGGNYTVDKVAYNNIKVTYIDRKGGRIYKGTSYSFPRAVSICFLDWFRVKKGKK